MKTIYTTNLEGITKKTKDLEANCWIHLQNPTNSELEEVAIKTNMDITLLRKVLDDEEISRIEPDEDVTMIVVNYPYVKDKGKKNRYRTMPLGIVMNDQYIVTLALTEIDFLSEFTRGKVKDFYTSKKTRFIIQLLFKISSSYLKCLREINREITSKEAVLYHSTQNKELINLLNLERSLVYFITNLKANDVVLERLAKGNVIDVFEEDMELLEDAMIENRQGMEMANIYREILTSMTDTYATIISNNLNTIMKFLAGITIVFSIPTMISSFMGMNVPLGKLATHPFSFIWISIFALVVSLIVAWILKKRNML